MGDTIDSIKGTHTELKGNASTGLIFDPSIRLRILNFDRNVMTTLQFLLSFVFLVNGRIFFSEIVKVNFYLP